MARISAPVALSAGFADANAAAQAAVIVSDASANAVNVYSLKGKLLATIAGLQQPQGLAADLSANLYIANTSASDILIYKNDYKTLKATLTDPNQYPAGVDVDTSTGVVGVTNIIDTSGGPGSVSFYAKGATTPCNTVSSSSFARVYFGAFDGAHAFYVDGVDANGVTIVGVVKGGCKAKTIATLTTTNTIKFPGGIHVTPFDGPNNTKKIAIDDQSGPAIYTYSQPVNGALGTPVLTTSLSGASDPVNFAFTSSAADVWTADAGLGEALEYKYYTGGSPIQTITGLSQPIGVVVTPVETPR